MFGPFKLKKKMSRGSNVDLDDTLRIKKALLGLGYYQTPKYGLTKYPDERLFKSIESFQSDNGLTKDGLMKPEGPTAATLGERVAEQSFGQTISQQMQAIKRPGAGRNLLDGDDGGKPGNPPGGDKPKPPGDKPKPPDDKPKPPDDDKPKPPKPTCASERLAAWEASQKYSAVDTRITELTGIINNLKIKIAQDKIKIALNKNKELAGQLGGALTRSPNIFAILAGIVSEVAGKTAGGDLQETEAKLAGKISKLKGLEEELAVLQNELKNLAVEKATAEEKLKRCEDGG